MRNYSPLLRPRRTLYRKSQKNIRAILPAPNDPPVPPKPYLPQGTYGIYAKKGTRLTAAQLEAARLSITRTIGRKGLKLWVVVFPHIPVTRKPQEVRMGKGKGSVDHFICNLRAGKLIFEYNCPSLELAKQACKAASYKLPIDVGFVEKKTSTPNKT